MDFGAAVQQTPEGGYIIAGDTDSFGAGSRQLYVLKTDAEGNLLWSKTFGTAGSTGSWSVVVTIDNEYVIAGFTARPGSRKGDAYLIKLDSNGNVMWTRTYGGNNYDFARTVRQTSDGGYILTGGTRSFGAGGLDAYLVKTDMDGNLLWSKTFGGPDSDYGSSVQQTFEGGYIIAGATESFGAGAEDIYLIKTDANGDTLWTRTHGGSDSEFGRKIIQTADNGFLITGAERRNAYLIKTDGEGRITWKKTYSGGMFSALGTSVQETSDHGYLWAGYTLSSPGTGYDGYLIKTDSKGETQWIKILDGPRRYDFIYDAIEIPGEAFIVVGTKEVSSQEGWIQTFLAKLALDSTSVSDEPGSASPESFTLAQNYPNPFNPATTIRYALPKRSHVRIEVFNLLGERVTVLRDEMQTAGYHAVKLEAQGLPGGVYFYKMTAEEFVGIRKMLIVK